MPDTGVNASFKFGAATYDSDDCLSGWSLNDSIQEIVYQCAGVEQAAAGPRVATFAISLGLDATDTAKVMALYPGAEGAFEAHPGGDTATYIEVVATDALITQANKSAPQNGIISLDLQIRLQDITIQVAS